ncbi:uncharacterized protein [Ptychodera flava]|uniref:uncharacterized protein n=1 Tax=Ptychodera flava TaxID=63121 RepID=UPI003969E821
MSTLPLLTPPTVGESRFIAKFLLTAKDHRTLFYPLVCKYLHVDTRQWMNFTLRFFSAVLQHAFLTYGDIVLSAAEITNQNQVYVPVDLMSKFCYLVPRLNPDVRWNTEPHCQSSGPSNFTPACVLYRSKDFQALQQQSKKVSLKDLVSLELQVQPHQDYLNEVERHDYHHWVIHSHYLALPVDDGGCDGSYRHACSVLMDAILDHDTLVQRNKTNRNHSIRSCDSSKSCDQRSDNDCGSCRSDIICCLQKLILYLSMEKHSTDDNSKQPWLLTEILKRLHEGNTGRSLTHQLTCTGQVICLMRLVQCLPGYLLYTDSPVDPISADSRQEVAHLIDNNLREVLVDECFPCVLPYSVTLHFVTFHWPRLKPVILKISRDHYSSHFQDIDKIYQWCESLVTESRDTASIPPSSVVACPLTLAVAVYQALTERKVPPTSACEIIAVINRQNSQIGREVCFHLMECLTAAVANQTYFPVQESYQTSLLSQLIPHYPDSICRVFIEMDAANGHNRLVLPVYIGKLYPAVFFRLMKVLTRKVHQALLMCRQFFTSVIQMYNSCVKLHADSSSEEDALPVNADRFFQNEVMSLQFMNEASTFAQWCVSQASLSAIRQISSTTVEACSSELRNAISRRMKIT